MNADERRRYRDAIAQELEEWAPDAEPDDHWWPLIQRLPEWFDGLVTLSSDDVLDDRQRRVVRRVTKYLISPLDLRPEFIYGPEGYREDLALIAWAVLQLAKEVGCAPLERHDLEPESDYWNEVTDLAEADLDEDLRQHLLALLTADSVAGDEDLAWADSSEDLLAPSPEPEAGGHTIVFAGPGTGKTFRLEQELWRLLTEEAIEPEHILVTTFTNKAADELVVRVHQRLCTQGRGNADLVMQQLSISTIHSFCFRLINRFHHHALFLKGTFSPMGATQRLLFLFRYGHQLRVFPIYQDWKQERLAAKGRLSIDMFHFYEYVGEIYDFLSEDVLCGVERGLRHRYLQLIRKGGASTVDERIIATYPHYWQLVQEEGFLDHSMQLAYAEALLDDPQVRRQVQDTYRHVLVDEYQDTNPIQDRIFRAVVGRGGCLFAVGDDDQSIYAFRGADVRNATEFTKRWPGAHVEKLEENRRSTKALVTAASQLIRHNRVRESKDLYTENSAGVAPWHLDGEPGELPAKLAELLAEMHERGAIRDWRDVAILFRGMTKRVPLYLKALHEVGIPAQTTGDHRFLKEPVVHSFLAILDLIAEEELKLSPRTRKHRDWFRAVGIADRDKMARMVERWRDRLHSGEYETLIDLFYAMLRDSGALKVERLMPALGRLSAFVAEAEAQLRSPEIVKRLSFFNGYAEAAATAYEGPEAEPEDAVSLMTIHKSKGLEFRVVVIADVDEGSIPAKFPVDVRTRLRRDLAGLESRIDPEEEERRVLYVGMTRAEAYLVIATSKKNPSRFLAEFDQLPPPDAGAIPNVIVHKSGPRQKPEPPLHTHHSAIYNYHFCPRRYLLESRYEFAGRPIAPLRAGQSLHRALEIYHRLLRDGERVTSDRRRRIFERAWVRPRGERAAEQEGRQLYQVFTEYADYWEAGKREHGLRTVEVERPFFVAEGRGVMTGRIDLVREREGQLEIVEFKYHKNQMMPKYPKRQLEHYSLAYPEEKPGLVVHYLKEGKEEEIERRDPEPVREELESVFNNIVHRQFDATPSKRTCRLCPVRFACVANVADKAA